MFHPYLAVLVTIGLHFMPPLKKELSQQKLRTLSPKAKAKNMENGYNNILEIFFTSNLEKVRTNIFEIIFTTQNLEMFKANIRGTFLHKNLEMAIEKVLEIIFTRKNL